MLTGNSQDFKKPSIFYLDPQTRAIAGSVNEKLLLLICTIFPLFSSRSSPLHRLLCFQNKLLIQPPWDHKFMPQSHKPKCTDPAGLRTNLQRADMEASPVHVQHGAIFAPSGPRKGSTSKPLTTALGNSPQWEAEKQDRIRQKSRLEEMSRNEKRTLAARSHHFN